jgi:ABC transporter substrate binding protein
MASLGPAGGVIVLPDAFTSGRSEKIISLGNRLNLPAVYPFRFFVARGGLLSYGTDNVDMYRLGASYVDRILKGAKPSSLPVQAPTKFEMVVNLRTAKDLGLVSAICFAMRVALQEYPDQRMACARSLRRGRRTAGQLLRSWKPFRLERRHDGVALHPLR